MIIDQDKLNDLTERPLRPAAASELWRSGSVFFVGGELPVTETLETMFESFCTESTELFHLSFGALNTVHRGEEMARQIKKNFNVRLMGQLDHPAPTEILQRLYAAGVDIINIPLGRFVGEERDSSASYGTLLAARSVFPRWSVASTLFADVESPSSTMKGIDMLLADGIVPLVALAGTAAATGTDGIAAVFRHLAAGWKRSSVPIKPYLPLIGFMTPLVPAAQPGVLRGLFDRLHDRRRLVASDLRRHLRVTTVEDSLDSAAL